MKKIALFITASLLFLSCAENSNNDTYNNQPLEPMAWKLINVSGSIAGLNDNFTPGVIVWTFNTDNTVTVVNNNTDESLTDFFDTGSYPYGYMENTNVPEACDNIIYISEIDFGCVAINGDTMVLEQPYEDGYILTFSK